ncbi:MAG TPA: hypothetical protein VME66_03125 [Candidatus Acidoferrales bacterium]|nr:hypothetical protein [Candidatus Acidoferrales bacterium]
MARFRFALQPLLAQRAQVEETACAALARQEHLYDAALAELASTEAAIAACTASLGAHALIASCDVLAHAALLQRRRCLQTAQAERARIAWEGARRSLQQARLGREQLEIARRWAYDASLARERLADERELDDVNHTRPSWSIASVCSPQVALPTLPP